MNKPITIKAMLPGEIARLYGVSVRTLYNWLKPFDQKKLERKTTRYFTPKQVRYIFKCLDYPETKIIESAEPSSV